MAGPDLEQPHQAGNEQPRIPAPVSDVLSLNACGIPRRQRLLDFSAKPHDPPAFDEEIVPSSDTAPPQAQTNDQLPMPPPSKATVFETPVTGPNPVFIRPNQGGR